VAVRFVALWSKPEDVEGFEQHYRTTHMEIVSRWPGVRSTSITRISAAPMGGESPYHLVFEATLASQQDLDALMASPEMGEAGKDVREIGQRFGAHVTALTGGDF
jgi:uncharacterized protein (TIGR02118 family)